MYRIRHGAAPLLTILAASCIGDGAEGPSLAVRDSAGVRVVENGDLPVAEWSVGAEPLFTVGWDDDHPPFTWLQSGRIIPDGGALVGDFSAGTIYQLGSDGTVVQTWGRKGEGPGEYQALDAILMRGDSIFVSDGRLGRLTLLAPDGGVRTTTMPAASGHAISSLLTDGRVLLIPGEGYGAVTEMRAEWVFETMPILAMNPGESAVDTLAELPHLRRWYGTRGASPGPVHVKGRAGGFAGGFAWGRSDEREVRWYDGSGRLRQVSRWQEQAVALTLDQRDRMMRSYEDAFRTAGLPESFMTAQVAELQELLDRYDGPLPYWDTFKVDRLENIWLSAYTPDGQPRRHEWRVFADDGTAVGWIDLPDLIDVLDITDDRILAVRRDQLDVPAVVMLDLIKP